MIPPQSLTDIAPEKLPFHPIGKDRLPVSPFFRVELLKFGGYLVRKLAENHVGDVGGES